jgi:hypothetical protein
MSAAAAAAMSTTAAAATAAISTAAAATAAAIVFTGSSFVYLDASSIDVVSVELLDGEIALFSARHFDEAEAFRLTAVTVHYYICVYNSSELSKQLPKFHFCDCVR